MIMFISFFISLVFLSASDDVPIHIYMEDKILNNRKLNWRGIWEVEYKGYNYTTVNYKTLPHRIINWETPDSFYVKHFNRIYPTPIINPQTVSRRDGTGKQTLYLNENMIGNTYTIYGCFKDGEKVTKEDDFEGCSKLKFKVK